jgi:hypothetical protein
MTSTRRPAYLTATQFNFLFGVLCHCEELSEQVIDFGEPFPMPVELPLLVVG